MSQLPTRPPLRSMRRAAAAAELALCLPLIVFLFLASIEACSMIFLDHSLEIASYEGVRVAVNFDSTNASVLSRCNEIINERHVVGATVGINPSDVSHVNRGDRITISVSAPCTANALLPPWFYGGKKLTCSATMVKE